MDKIKALLLIACFMALCVMAISAISPAANTTDTIEMVQPCSSWMRWLCAQVDSQYAEHVNEPNSRSNVNNAEAARIVAETTRIAAEAEQQQAKTIEGQTGTFVAGAFWGTCLFFIGGIVLVGGGIYIFLKLQA